MKNRLKIISLTIIMFVNWQLEAQVSVPNNAGFPTDYVGWNNLQAFPLEIRHNANQPINFHTNNSADRRMTILGGGNVGIGLTAPSSLLHLNTTTGDLFRTDGAGANLTFGT